MDALLAYSSSASDDDSDDNSEEIVPPAKKVRRDIDKACKYVNLFFLTIGDTISILKW